MVVAAGSQEEGFSLRSFESETGDVRWTHALASGDFPAQLVAVDDVVIALSDGRSGQVFEGFEAASGKSRWRHPLSGRSSMGASEAAGSIVFANAGNDQVSALDPTSGEARWTTHQAGISGKEPVIVNGLVLVDSLTEIHALDATSGAVAWSVPASGDLDRIVALDGSVGAISIEPGSQPDMILEVFDSEGNLLWSFRNPNISVEPAPMATPNGVLVVTAPDPSTGDTVMMLNAKTGEPVWGVTPLHKALGPTGVLASGDIVTVSADVLDHSLGESTVALYRGGTGELVWETEIPGTVLIAPIDISDSLLVPAQTGGGSGGSVVSLDLATGKQRWLVDAALPPSSSPVVSDGAILVGSARRLDLEPGSGSGVRGP